MKIYAVVPARSGSKGLPNKNIREIEGKPLISYSINFANKLQHVSKVFCSTDSEVYADIAKKYDAEVPFLRSEFAARDTAMEPDILKDLREKFKAYDIEEPDIVVWLRPTFVFRNANHINDCIEKLISNNNYTSARTVVSAESRLYKLNNNNLLEPSFEDGGKSMMRRQDVGELYKVFSTDVFRFKGNDFDEDFLGRQVYAVETDKICGLDIDDLTDFEIVKALVENNKGIANEYL